MRLRVVVFGLLGTLATGLAAGLLFAPDVFLGFPPVDAALTVAEETDRRQLLLGGSLVAGLSLLVAARSATQTGGEATADDAFEDATAEPPELVTTARKRQTAASLDDQFEAAIDGDVSARDSVCERLRGAATRAYAHTTGCSTEDARRAVARGDWTDDRTAAAFLADESGPDQSLWARLRLWLDPDRERARRLRRTVESANDLTERWR
ncbi:hypothetical protein BRC91_07950 [Halobacteriales archaeon QS_4_62_28]|nr:MAG: hypothetical protein BRC91_07950 [Halobacteriales archaeon QS_4_62_28]